MKTMPNEIQWEPKPAESITELANVLLTCAYAVKTQVLASPVLANPEQSELKTRLSEFASELISLQGDAVIPAEIRAAIAAVTFPAENT